jgi:hypothetical protein
MDSYCKRHCGSQSNEKMTKSTLENLDKIESSLMQPKAKAPQDVLAYPIQLNDKMAGLGSNIHRNQNQPEMLM